MSIWQGMMARCYTPEGTGYRHYGGRGIKVCDLWQDFERFYADMGDRPSRKHSIERLDVNGDYEPSNCVWATRKEQARNKRDTLFVEHEGVRHKFADLCETKGWDYRVTLKRYRRGWPLELAGSGPRGARLRRSAAP